MKDFELIEKVLDKIAQSGDMEIEIEARDLERICTLALTHIKSKQNGREIETTNC